MLGIACLLLATSLGAQTIKEKLQTAYQQFEADSQLRHAISSLYVINAKTGEVFFDRNSQIGLAGASTQKIITAATAFDLLGKDFRYSTEFGYTGTITNKTLDGSIYIKGSLDPTLGSWRWPSTKEDSVMFRITAAIKKLGIANYKSILVNDLEMEDEVIPDGWMWQDIGNYYGAGAGMFNWRENQYDMILKSGVIRGERVKIVETKPKLYGINFISYLKSAAKGSGDNAYIYLPVGSSTGTVRGTIPVAEDHFIISGAMPSARNQFLLTLIDSLKKKGIKNRLNIETIGKVFWQKFSSDWITTFHIEFSPSLDSIVYWFLRRSINLYGEALLKTIGSGSRESGIDTVKNFWQQKGLDPEEINIKDGSGLSPQNRITTHAQVEVLKYAKQQSWFPYFFDALPEFNNMKMKSGTINDVKGFCGYQTSVDGNEYIFSFLVNNYSGRSSTVVNKMYKVLDVLK